MRSITRRISMRWFRCQFVVLLLTMAVTAATRAEGLTLDQAVQQSLAHNRELQAARYSMDVAQGRLQQAGLWPNPRLQFDSASDKTFADDGEFSRNLGFGQDFPIAGRIRRQKGVARVDVALALAEINEAERRLAGQVAAQFYSLLIIDRGIALREELIDVERSLVGVTQNRLLAGEVSELDVNTATLELERLIAERDVLLGGQDVAVAELAASLGQTLPIDLKLDTNLPPVGPQPPLSVMTSRAYASRPDLRMRTLQADRARAEKALARASAWEDWTVWLGVQQDRIGVEGAPRQSTDKALSLSVTIPLPLFNRNQGSMAAASAAEMQATQGVVALRLVIANDVAAAYNQLGRLETTLLAQQQRMLPLSQRNTTLARDSYSQGQISIIELIQVERLRNELRANYLNTYASYLQSQVRLKMATGAWSELVTRVSEYPAAANFSEN